MNSRIPIVRISFRGNLQMQTVSGSPSVFWALRGGGAGSWGVIISATFRTFPTFDAVWSVSTFTANSSAAVGELAKLHAQHIFDWDDHRAGQYFYVIATPPTFTWSISTLFPNTSLAIANGSLSPFLNAVAAE